MPNLKKTEIVVVLDRSGSMHSIKTDMEGGFEKFMQDQAAAPGKCRVSLYQFDQEYQVVYEDRAAKDCLELELVPRGVTALFDGIGKTLARVEERHALLPGKKRPGTVVVLVITDGQENASREWDLVGVKKAIKSAEDRGWDLVFLAANATAFTEGASLQFKSTYNAGASGQSIGTAYVSTSKGIVQLRESRSSGDLSASLYVDDPSQTVPSKM